MAQHDKTDTNKSTDDAQANPSRSGPRKIATKDLMGADREIIIDHEGAEYHLRVTSNGRLILTK